MLELIRRAATPEGRAALIPPPGVERLLKRAGRARFAYPEDSLPSSGPVVIAHRRAGGLELRVTPTLNPRLTGRVGQLFSTGAIALGGPEEVSGLGDELLAQWASAAGPDRWRVDAAEVDALRAAVPTPTAAWLAAALTHRIVGQDEPLSVLASATARHLRKLHPQAPCSVLLIGPTGVGKTEAALQLVEALREAEPDRGWSSFVVDGGEITGEDQLNRVLGAAPGYVGYDQGSPLANALGSGPAVLIFDEVEKAHPALLNRVLLGLLDRGRVSVPNPERGQERALDASEGVVVFTSNLAVDELRPGLTSEALREHLRRNGLRPELVGRLGEVVQFGPLDPDALVTAACLATEAVLGEYGLVPRTIAPAYLAACLDAHDARSGVRGIRVVVERRLSLALEPMLDAGHRGAVDVLDSPETLRPA